MIEETITRKEAGEMAAEYMFHFMEDLGSTPSDCLHAAQGIYSYLTNHELLNVEMVLGFTEEELETNFGEEDF